LAATNWGVAADRFSVHTVKFANKISAGLDESLLPAAIFAGPGNLFNETQNFGRIKQADVGFRPRI